jgi:hypothetical protein
MQDVGFRFVHSPSASFRSWFESEEAHFAQAALAIRLFVRFDMFGRRRNCFITTAEWGITAFRCDMGSMMRFEILASNESNRESVVLGWIQGPFSVWASGESYRASEGDQSGFDATSRFEWPDVRASRPRHSPALADDEVVGEEACPRCDGTGRNPYANALAGITLDLSLPAPSAPQA